MLPALGRIVGLPAIADCKTNSVREVISFKALASLLASGSEVGADLEALASAEFDLSPEEVLTVSAGGLVYRVDTRHHLLLEVKTALGAPALYSPDGRFACLVEGDDLWLQDLSSGARRPLTHDGAADYFYGRQSQTNLAALSSRRCPQPVGLWSPDSRWFLTAHIDERGVPERALIQHAAARGGPVLHRYKYPVPGDPLPVAVLCAIEVSSGRMVRFEEFPISITSFAPFQLRRVWFDDLGRVWLLRHDRYWKQADLISLDLREGIGHLVMNETASSGYLDFNPSMIATPNVRTLAGSEEVIWYSERDGWGHLYLYDASTGKIKNRMTGGDWLVRDIVHVDEKSRTVLLLAGGEDPNADPARRTLCRVGLDGTGFEVLLTHDGDISVPVTGPCGLGQEHPGRPKGAQAGISPSGDFCVVRFTSVTHGNRSEIVDLRSRRGFVIASAGPEPDERAPRLFSSTAADGVTRLHGCLFLPSDFDAGQRYPLIDYIYPGPQAAHQPQSFHSVSSALARVLAELGFITLMLDTRATPISSRAFHHVGYGGLLEPQLADHAAVVRDLCKTLPFIDEHRIGIIGHSAGGAAAARAMFDYGALFKVGVSVCGNHDPSQYAAIWADKYCGPDSAAKTAVCNNSAAAHKLQGKLLLVHGDMDENVQVSQTLSLADALIRANRTFDLLVVPGADHGMLMTHGYTQRRVWDYLVRNLLGKEPPPEFEVSFVPYEIECCQRRGLQELQ